MINKSILMLILIEFGIAQFNVNKEFYKYSNLYGIKSVENTKLFQLNASFLASTQDELVTHIEVAPIINLNFNEELDLKFKLNLHSDNDFYKPNILSNPFYKYKKFRNVIAYTEEAFLRYKTRTIDLKVGRFIDRLGSAPIENLIISNNDYHEGYRIHINYKDIVFSNRFFQLSPFRQNSNVNRFFHEHGLKWTIDDKWSISFHETAIYAGVNASPGIAFLNPLSIYYLNQTNDGINSNTNWSILIRYENENISMWSEFLVDDFQIDSHEEKITNNEPAEIGIQIGTQYRYEKHSLYLNMALLTNRTYNDQNTQIDSNLSFTKYVDHDKIIGFHLGSNLINLEVIYQYLLGDDILISYHFSNTNRGDESVFSPFNEDFLVQGEYKEPIPYGTLTRQTTHTIRLEKTIFDVRAFLSTNYRTISNKNDIGIYFGLNYLL